MVDPLQALTALGEWTQAHPWLALGGLGAVPVLIGGSTMVRAVLRQAGMLAVPAPTHGTARWATLRECRKGGLVSESGLVLGTVQHHILRAGSQSAPHVLNVGPTGSGKDYSINYVNTVAWPHSLLIFDPKDGGENYALFAEWRKQFGPVYRFAPTMRDSASLNLLDAVRVGEPEEWHDVGVIVQSHLAPMDKGYVAHGSAAFYKSQAETTLQAITLRQLHSGSRKSFAGVLASMANPAGCIAGLVTSAHPSVRMRGIELQAMRRQGEEQFQGVWDEAVTGLKIYRDPLVAQHTESSDFRLADLQVPGKPMTLYLGARTQAEVKTYVAPLLRSVLDMAFHSLTDVPLPPEQQPLLWLLNEMPLLGYMPIIEEAPATARSRSMRFLISCQDLSDVWRTFGKETTLWSNLGIKAFHAPTNDETAKRISQMLCEQTVQTTSTSQSAGRRSTTTHDLGRALLDQAEVLGLDQDTLLIRAQWVPHPVRARKLRYDQDWYY